MLQVSQSCDYAVRGLMYLAATQADAPVSVDEVAKAQGIPKHYLSKIFQLLMRSGIIHSYRGIGGGYMLALPPDQITLKRVFEAIEGPVVVNQCIHPTGCNRCPLHGECAIEDVWDNMRDELLRMLASVTIQNLVDKQQQTHRYRKARAVNC